MGTDKVASMEARALTPRIHVTTPAGFVVPPAAANRYRYCTITKRYSIQIAKWRRSSIRMLTGSSDDDDLLRSAISKPQKINIGDFDGSSSERVGDLVMYVRQQLGHPPDWFVESMHHDPIKKAWTETSRYIKYKQVASHDGHHWGRPHVGCIDLPSLLLARQCFTKGLVMLSETASCYLEVVEEILDGWQNRGQLHVNRNTVRTVLLSDRKHLVVRHHVTEVGARVQGLMPRSTSKIDLEDEDDKVYICPDEAPSRKASFSVNLNEMEHEPSVTDSPLAVGSTTPRPSTLNLLTPDSVDFDRISMVSNVSSVSRKSRKSSISNKSLTSPMQLAGLHLLRRLPTGSEGTVVHCATVDGLEETLFAFVSLAGLNRRILSDSVAMENILEVDLPVRCLVYILAPHRAHPETLDSLAEAMSSLLSDEVFRCVTLVASDGHDLAAAVDEYLRYSVVYPPDKVPVGHQLLPPDHHVAESSRMMAYNRGSRASSAVVSVNRHLHDHEVDEAFLRTGKLFGGLFADIRRKSRWYWQDFNVFVSAGHFVQAISAVLVVYLAQLAILATYGVIYNNFSHHEIGITEQFLGAAICGMVHALFSGQPLNILSATTPVQVYEYMVYKLMKNFNVASFTLVGRFWISLWCALFMLVLVAVDASALLAWVTPFTEEAFAVIVACMFIYSSVIELLDIIPYELDKISHTAPIITDPTSFWNDTCKCDSDHGHSAWDPQRQSFDDFYDSCTHYNGSTLSGAQCDFHPDVFLFCVILFLSTFGLAVLFQKFRETPFLPSWIRKFMSKFAIVLAILIMSVVSWLVHLEVPKFEMPDSIKTRHQWIVNPFDIADLWQLPLYTALPGLLLTVLIFMEHQHSYGYHLDLLVIAVLLVVCGLMGLPFFIAQVLLSTAHVETLSLQTEYTAPGEHRQHLGVREQRVTAFIISFLVLLTSVLGKYVNVVLREIPQPVLFAVLLFLGYSELSGSLYDRCLLMLTPRKYHPDTEYLRLIRLPKVHLYTVIQLSLSAVAFGIKFGSTEVSIYFPLFLVLFIIIRHTLRWVYTEKQLAAIDHPLPTWAQLNPHRTKSHHNKHVNGGVTNLDLQDNPVSNKSSSSSTPSVLGNSISNHNQHHHNNKSGVSISVMPPETPELSIDHDSPKSVSNPAFELDEVTEFIDDDTPVDRASFY